jgi:hypothetical protein
VVLPEKKEIIIKNAHKRREDPRQESVSRCNQEDQREKWMKAGKNERGYPINFRKKPVRRRIPPTASR